MPVLRKSRTAETDLIEIWTYVAANGSQRSADSLIDQFKAEFDLLAANPLAGVARPDLQPRLRSWPVGNYIVFYRPLRTGIEVARVIHGARNCAKVFGRRKR